MKILEIFGENWLKFVEKYKLINNWRIISIREGKLRNACKICAFGPEKTFFLILRFFDQNLYGKLTFFVNFHEISSIISASAPKVLPLEDSTRFLQHSFGFGGNRLFPLPTPLIIYQNIVSKFSEMVGAIFPQLYRSDLLCFDILRSIFEGLRYLNPFRTTSQRCDSIGHPNIKKSSLEVRRCSSPDCYEFSNSKTNQTNRKWIHLSKSSAFFPSKKLILDRSRKCEVIF